MARRSTALAKSQKALASAKKRAADLRKNIKKDQPMEIAATIGGGYAAGWVDSNQPAFLAGLGGDQFNASTIIGVVLTGYGLFSARSGQMEKLSTALGTGMLSAAAYNFAKEA